MNRILITRTNRGIGLELCRQYVLKGFEAIATCRQASEALLATGATVISIREQGLQ